MMHRKTIQNGLVTCLIAGVLVLGFLYLFEKDQVERTTPESEEARKNPYLAAERFLSQWGLNVESTADRDILIHPPGHDHLIFVSRFGGNLPADREDNLIAWMEQGGTLMVTHNKVWNENRGKSGNTLLDRLGILMHNAYDLEAEPEDTDENADGMDTRDTEEENGEPGEEPVDEGENPYSMFPGDFFANTYDTETVTVPFDDGITATIECVENRVLENADGESLADHDGESGSHIIVKAVGQGRLVVLSDSEWLKNKNIGENDHAYVLGRIAAGHGKIWLLYTSIMPSFFMTMLAKAPFVMVSLMIFCLVFVLWLTRSIGPRYRVRDHYSRNIAEHLLAAGMFTLSRGTGQALIHGTRSAINQRIRNRYLFFNHKSREEQEDYLARWTGLSTDDIHGAFHGPVEKKEAFIVASATLQKITQDVVFRAGEKSDPKGP